MNEQQQKKRGECGKKRRKLNKKKMESIDRSFMSAQIFLVYLFAPTAGCCNTATAVLREISFLRHSGWYIANFALRQLFLLNEICSETSLRPKATVEVCGDDDGNDNVDLRSMET